VLPRACSSRDNPQFLPISSTQGTITVTTLVLSALFDLVSVACIGSGSDTGIVRQNPVSDESTRYRYVVMPMRIDRAPCNSDGVPSNLAVAASPADPRIGNAQTLRGRPKTGKNRTRRSGHSSACYQGDAGPSPHLKRLGCF
jgi:hypothetical protein